MLLSGAYQHIRRSIGIHDTHKITKQIVAYIKDLFYRHHHQDSRDDDISSLTLYNMIQILKSQSRIALESIMHDMKQQQQSPLLTLLEPVKLFQQLRLLYKEVELILWLYDYYSYHVNHQAQFDPPHGISTSGCDSGIGSDSRRGNGSDTIQIELFTTFVHSLHEEVVRSLLLQLFYVDNGNSNRINSCIIKNIMLDKMLNHNVETPFSIFELPRMIYDILNYEVSVTEILPPTSLTASSSFETLPLSDITNTTRIGTPSSRFHSSASSLTSSCETLSLSDSTISIITTRSGTPLSPISSLISSFNTLSLSDSTTSIITTRSGTPLSPCQSSTSSSFNASSLSDRDITGQCGHTQSTKNKQNDVRYNFLLLYILCQTINKHTKNKTEWENLFSNSIKSISSLYLMDYVPSIISMVTIDNFFQPISINSANVKLINKLLVTMDGIFNHAKVDFDLLAFASKLSVNDLKSIFVQYIVNWYNAKKRWTIPSLVNSPANMRLRPTFLSFQTLLLCEQLEHDTNNYSNDLTENIIGSTTDSMNDDIIDLTIDIIDLTLDQDEEGTVEQNTEANIAQNEDLLPIRPFRRIYDHQGPLAPGDEGYKGSVFNLSIHWEDGDYTWEPLHRMKIDDPVTCAIYADENGLMDEPGWAFARDHVQN